MVGSVLPVVDVDCFVVRVVWCGVVWCAGSVAVAVAVALASSNLRTHERSHTGEKRFPCMFPGCDRRFAHFASRKEHELAHGMEPTPGKRVGLKKA
jgi:hypothetical protein